MKFLENEKLAQLTSLMTDAIVGTGERIINGRIEAFTMKRAGNDKKLAHELGEKYQAEIQVVETEFKQYQKSIGIDVGENDNVVSGYGNGGSSSSSNCGKKRSESIEEDKLKLRKNASFHKRVRIEALEKDSKGRRRSNSIAIPVVPNPKSKPKSRSRSGSYDLKSILKPPQQDIRASRSMSEPSVSNPTADFINSPLGDFHDSSTQRLMTDLILTLNSSFPDYEFSNIRPSHFMRLPSPNVAINQTNERLSELELNNNKSNTNNNNQGPTFFSQLWSAIDEVISMNESEVYSYVPPQRDDDDDPLGFLTQTLDGRDSDKVVPLWTLNFFFVNKSMKRIVLFTCVQTMRNEVSLIGNGDGEEDDEMSNFFVQSDEVKETRSYDNYGFSSPGFRSSLENSVLDDDDDDEQNWNDFDMDTDVMGQAAPPATMA